MEDIGIDSLGFYEILIEADTCFGIRIQEEQLLKFKTVGDIQNHLDSLEIDPPAPKQPDRGSSATLRTARFDRGMGSVSPSAVTPNPPGTALAGRSGITALREDWSNDLPVRISGCVPDAATGPLLLRRSDRCAQLGLLAARGLGHGHHGHRRHQSCPRLRCWALAGYTRCMNSTTS